MNRRHRLTHSADFKRVRQHGKSFPHPLIVLIVMPNELPFNRFAVVAGRGVGRSVQRNRAKRLIRAVVQEIQPSIKLGWDIIIIARRSMAHASYDRTKEAMTALFRRAQLIRLPENNGFVP